MKKGRARSPICTDAMRIHCPFCGERDSGEFTVTGDAGCRIPSSDTSEGAFEAVYVRDNPAGRHSELWYHSGGCRSWLQVTRDTRTHEIFDVKFAHER
jgi:methylglutamate dehydrogenase subunit B